MQGEGIHTILYRTVVWPKLELHESNWEFCKFSRKKKKKIKKYLYSFASSSSTSCCILCFNNHIFLLSCYINANDYDHSFLCCFFFSPSPTVKDFCSVTECVNLSTLEPMFNWRQSSVFIQEQFAGKHPEFKILMMGGSFSSFFPPLF